jgi:predicted enzyme related to lactoylglutathione lyase
MADETPSLAGRKVMQVAMTSRDLERSKVFYRDVLGLPFLMEVSGMAFFQAGDLRLMVGLAQKPDDPIGGSVVYFDAPDIDTLGPALEAKGVAFHGPAQVLQRTDTHELKLRSFKDPDGNALALMGMAARA